MKAMCHPPTKHLDTVGVLLPVSSFISEQVQQPANRPFKVQQAIYYRKYNLNSA